MSLGVVFYLLGNNHVAIGDDICLLAQPHNIQSEYCHISTANYMISDNMSLQARQDNSCVIVNTPQCVQ